LSKRLTLSRRLVGSDPPLPVATAPLPPFSLIELIGLRQGSRTALRLAVSLSLSSALPFCLIEQFGAACVDRRNKGNFCANSGLSFCLRLSEVKWVRDNEASAEIGAGATKGLVKEIENGFVYAQRKPNSNCKLCYSFSTCDSNGGNEEGNIDLFGYAPTHTRSGREGKVKHHKSELRFVAIDDDKKHQYQFHALFAVGPVAVSGRITKLEISLVFARNDSIVCFFIEPRKRGIRHDYQMPTCTSFSFFNNDVPSPSTQHNVSRVMSDKEELARLLRENAELRRRAGGQEPALGRDGQGFTRPAVPPPTGWAHYNMGGGSMSPGPGSSVGNATDRYLGSAYVSQGHADWPMTKYGPQFG
jgi:hypothetical protein